MSATGPLMLSPNVDRSAASGASAGVATLRANEPMMDLAANVRLTTAAQKYDWVNTRQIWGLATINLATGKIHLESFMQ